MNDPIKVVADALRRPHSTSAPFGQPRTTTLARVAVQALYDAGYRLIRDPELDHEEGHRHD